MKEVKLDALERVHIPKTVMKEMKWTSGQKLIVSVEEDKVIITAKKPDQICPLCSKKFTSEFVFCPYCGEYLRTETDE